MPEARRKKRAVPQLLSILLLVACLLACSGCVSVLKRSYTSALVEVRLDAGATSGYALQVGADGPLIHANSDGRFELTLPEIPRRCERYLMFPQFAISRYRVPELRVLRNGKLAARHSVETVYHLAEENGGVVEISVR